MSYKVVFSGEGFDHTAYFDCAMSCDLFARLMANDGRLLRVKADGQDITDKYVATITIN